MVFRHQRIQRFQQGLWHVAVLGHPHLLTSHQIMAVKQNHGILPEFAPEIQF
jgi:hypothetical protein